MSSTKSKIFLYWHFNHIRNAKGINCEDKFSKTQSCFVLFVNYSSINVVSNQLSLDNNNITKIKGWQYITHDWLLGASPMQTDSSANFTWRASLSIVEYTATQGMPNSWAVLITRTAISPLFATKILSAWHVALRAPQCLLCLWLTWVFWALCFGKFTLFPNIKLHWELLIALEFGTNIPFHSKKETLYIQMHINIWARKCWKIFEI